MAGCAKNLSISVNRSEIFNLPDEVVYLASSEFSEQPGGTISSQQDHVKMANHATARSLIEAYTAEVTPK